MTRNHINILCNMRVNVVNGYVVGSIVSIDKEYALGQTLEAMDLQFLGVRGLRKEDFAYYTGLYDNPSEMSDLMCYALNAMGPWYDWDSFVVMLKKKKQKKQK